MGRYVVVAFTSASRNPTNNTQRTTRRCRRNARSGWRCSSRVVALAVASLGPTFSSQDRRPNIRRASACVCHHVHSSSLRLRRREQAAPSAPRRRRRGCLPQPLHRAGDARSRRSQPLLRVHFVGRPWCLSRSHSPLPRCNVSVVRRRVQGHGRQTIPEVANPQWTL